MRFLFNFWVGGHHFGFAQIGIVSLGKLNLFGTVQIGEFGMFLNIYINNASNQYDFRMLRMWKRSAYLQVQLVLAFQTFILSYLLLLVETQTLTQ